MGCNTSWNRDARNKSLKSVENLFSMIGKVKNVCTFWVVNMYIYLHSATLSKEYSLRKRCEKESKCYSNIFLKGTCEMHNKKLSWSRQRLRIKTAQF